MSKLPIPRPARDLSAGKSAMEERLAAMRRAAGIGERRALHLLCSETGKPFTIIFSRKSDRHLFRIEATQAASPPESSLLGRLFAAPKQESVPLDRDALDFSGFRCPHCGHAGTADRAEFFRCYCERLQCGARIDVMNGVTRFACHDGCGRSGTLGGKISSLSGESADGTPQTATGNQGIKRLGAPPLRLPGKDSGGRT